MYRWGRGLARGSAELGLVVVECIGLVEGGGVVCCSAGGRGV